jgi:hypothetical protein
MLPGLEMMIMMMVQAKQGNRGTRRLLMGIFCCCLQAASVAASQPAPAHEPCTSVRVLDLSTPVDDAGSSCTSEAAVEASTAEYVLGFGAPPDMPRYWCP